MFLPQGELGINLERNFEEGGICFKYCATQFIECYIFLTADRWDNLRSVVIVTDVECTPHPDCLPVSYNWNQASGWAADVRRIANEFEREPIAAFTRYLNSF